jgi:muramoyltetrapeptide carboxypeptidase
MTTSFSPLLIPPALGPGDRIAVVAPAGPVEPEELESGLTVLRKRFDVIPGRSLRLRRGYLAGTDEERLFDVERAFADPSIKAVIAARGGYGTTRLLDRLDLSTLQASPKWLVGCSDLTALLIHAHCRLGLATLHGPMAASLRRTEPSDVEELFELLSGAGSQAPQELAPLSLGQARGPLLGGNLTVLAHLVGTVDPSFLRGAILFLEDVGEAPYRLERCLVQLQRAGWLEEIGGVCVGELSDCNDDKYGVTALEALKIPLTRLGVPSAFGYPGAHGRRNRPFVHGQSAVLEVDSHRARLSFSAHG